VILPSSPREGRVAARGERPPLRALWVSVAIAAFLTVLAPCATANAETSPTPGGTPDLRGAWRMHLGGDDSFAVPAHDDTSWRSVELPSSWAEQGLTGYAGQVWYRKVVSIAAKPSKDQAAAHWGLLTGRTRFGAVQVWVEGQLVGQIGDGDAVPVPRLRVFAIPASIVDGRSTLLVALRVTRAAWASDRAENAGPVGDDLAVADYRELVLRVSEEDNAGLLESLPLLLAALLFLGVAGYFVYLSGRWHFGREYFWFGLTALGFSANSFLNGAWVWELTESFTLVYRLTEISGLLLAVLLLEFVWSLLSRPIGRWLRLYQAISLLLAVAVGVTPTLGWVVDTHGLRWLWLLPLIVAALWTTVAEARHGNRAARSVLAAGVFLAGVEGLAIAAHFLGFIPPLGLDPAWAFGVLVVALGMVLADRLNRTRRDLEKLTATLETTLTGRTGQLNESLAVSEDLFREKERHREAFESIVENNHEAILVVDRPGRLQYANAAARWLLESQPEGFLRECLERSKQGAVGSFPFVQGSGGASQAFEIGSSATTWKGEAATLLTVTDVSERRKLMDALHLLNDAVAVLPIGLTITDPSGVIRYCNPAEAEMHGLAADTLVGRQARELAPKESWRPMTRVEMDRTGVWTRESINLRADGSRFPVLLSSVAVRDQAAAVSAYATACIDLTEQTRIQKELEVSEARFRAMLERMPAVTLLLGGPEDTRVLYASPQIEGLTGYTAEEWLANGALWLDTVHPDDRERAARHASAARGTGRTVDFEYRRSKRSGEVTWVREFRWLIESPDGSRAAIQAMMFDITAARQAEEERRQRERDFQVVFEGAHDAALVFDPETEEILEANRRACELYGFPRERLVGLSLKQLSRDVARGESHIEETLRRGERQPFETTQYRIDGSEIVVEVSASTVQFRGKTAILSLHRDITERRRIEQQLTESLRREAALLHALPVAVYTATVPDPLDASWISDSVERLTGFMPDSFTTVSGFWSSRLHPDDKVEAIQTYRSIVSAGSGSVSYRWLARDGAYRWFLDTVTARLTGEDEWAVIGTITDITDQRETARALREREREHSALLAQLPVGVYRTTLDGRVLHANAALATLLDYSSPEELMDEADARAFYPDPRTRADLLARWAASPEPQTDELELVTRTGRRVRVRNTGRVVPAADGDPVFVEGVLEDVSERWRIAEDKELAERCLRLSAQVSAEFLASASPQEAAARVVRMIEETLATRRCFWFKAAVDGAGQVTGSLVDEWCGSGVRSFGEEPDLQRISGSRFPRWLERLAAGEIVTSTELEPPDGERRFLEDVGVGQLALAPLRVGGELVACIGLEQNQEGGPFTPEVLRVLQAASQAFEMAWDRAVRRRRVAELAEVVEQASEAVVIIDPAWRLTYVNEAFIKLTEFRRDEVLGRVAWRLIKVTEEARAALASLAKRQAWRGSTVLRHRTQGPIEVQSVVFPLQDEAGAVVAYASMHADMSAQRALENQLRRAEKMEALGQFAASVAHDFNNLLAVFESTTWLLERKLGKATCETELQILRRATGQGCDLARGLLGFARQQVLEKRTLDLGELVESFFPMLRRVIPESIQVRYRPPQQRVLSRVDRSQIEQALLNLVANARDAMLLNGTLTIGVDGVALDEAFVAANPGSRPGEYCMLTVRDTGCGMDAATRARVFEPFFTTKAPGHGTGLGLSSVLGIVKQHDGYVRVDSSPGAGATFSVYLPRAEATQSGPEERRPVASARTTTPLRVLLVEDETDLRATVAGVLKALGFLVSTAANGVEGLAAYIDASPSFDVIVTDVIMPLLSGPDMYRKLLAAGKDPAVLFLSGYSRDEATRLPIGPGVGHLAKPFDIEALATRLRQLVEERRAKGPRPEDDNHGADASS
jgi:two-component system, cell cycle sensor histidine kinase and response regulator CckA